MPSDRPLEHVVAFCESDTHAAMIEAMLDRGIAGIEHVLATGTFDRLARLNIPVTLLPAPAGQSPGTAWVLAQEVAREMLEGRQLLQFQDQGWTAQAVSMAAKAMGVPRTLVQDGYLTFDTRRSFGARRWLWPLTARLDRLPLTTPRPRRRVLLNRLLYRNHFFGITRPDKALVFGEAMKTRLRQQWGIPPGAIHVTGPLLRPASLQTGYAAPDPGQPLRVLFLDQCFLRYGRMDRSDWDERYLPLIRALSAYELTVKLHPSQPEPEVGDIEAAAGKKVLIAGRERLPEKLDMAVDVAVTVSSTAFISCLATGIPVIFCDCGALDVMPAFHHPLIKNCSASHRVEQALETFRNSGTFPANTGGEPLEDHLLLAGDKAFMSALQA
ncbi:glycosyltransferase family protein [Henriciella aquimarina]|uniref:hypothetical protein n=1 Tax=Henriciella aquimarina TaxID=545261 RepID=UPI0009FE0B0B|nr:hypothetical protein [Henriciella aquimarina]